MFTKKILIAALALTGTQAVSIQDNLTQFKEINLAEVEGYRLCFNSCMHEMGESYTRFCEAHCTHIGSTGDVTKHFM